MYEVAWQASTALLPAPASASAFVASRQHRHMAHLGGPAGEHKAVVIQYGRTTAPARLPLQGVTAKWMPASAAATGSRKQHDLASAADPAAITQGLELLQRLLADGSQCMPSSISLATSGALPAASFGCDVTGVIRRSSSSIAAAAAPAWGLARVADLEYADCSWRGMDVSPYAAHPEPTVG